MNNLSKLILNALTVNPMTGYDIAKKINDSWGVSHQQVYRFLKDLDKQMFVTFETIAQVDKPDKKLYTITMNGRNELRDSLPATELDVKQHSSALALSLLLGGDFDSEAREALKSMESELLAMAELPFDDNKGQYNWFQLKAEAYFISVILNEKD